MKSKTPKSFNFTLQRIRAPRFINLFVVFLIKTQTSQLIKRKYNKKLQKNFV